MGRIRTADIKDAAAKLLAAYPDRFSEDFERNKAVLAELKLFPSKRYRNRVAGYIVRLVLRQKR